MCGIGGIAGAGAPDPALLRSMAVAMAHRGPDGMAVWTDDAAGLAFRRLAIIDLDERSMQPLHLGPWHLAFNGEVYNYLELREELIGLGHAFRTEGDGEVLLHAWAEWEDAALDRINGMFAFGLWHDERQELVCATDPFGEKPLYWAQDGDRVVFASDVRAVLCARPDLGSPCPQALVDYVGRGLMPPLDASFFAGIHRLPGAHVLRVRGGTATVRRHWWPQPVDVPSAYPDAVAALRALLEDAVRIRLRADVPVGTSLSGGVDSSAVVSIAGSLAQDARRHAFTATFPGFARDEWRYAELVAERAGVVEHHAVTPTAEDLLDDLDQLVRSQEEPFGSLSIYAQWRVMRCAHESGVTVLLDGQGADELFGGYRGSNGWALRSEGPRAALRGLATPADRLDVLNAFGSERLPRWIRTRHRRGTVTPYASEAVREAAAAVEPPAVPGHHPLQRELLRQAFHTSLPQLLRYADRNSMAHSREVRLPFLDRRIAEFALSAPAAFLYRNGTRKALLRDAIADLAPREVLDRRDKVGFEAPQDRWLSTPAAVALIGDVLLDPAARASGLYDAALVEADMRTGRWRDPDGVWRALNAQLWQRAYDPAAGPAVAVAS